MKALPLAAVILLAASSALDAISPTGDSSRSSAFDRAAHVQVESPSNETIRVLDVSSSELVRSTVEAHRVDLGPSLDFSMLRASGRVQTGASLEHIGSASSDSTRQQFIPDELDGIRQRTIALQSAQRFTIERLNDDNFTTRELLIELAQIDAEARALNERRVALRDATSRTSDFSINSGRLTALERELDMFTGPVRMHAVVVMIGEAGAARFFIRTSETGVALSVVADDEYVRETYRADSYDHDQRTATYEEAPDIVAENYPTTYSSRITQSGASVISAGDSHHVRINYSYEQLTVYVDTGSGRVFKGPQTCPLKSISIVATATGVRDGLAFTVGRTYPGGPLRIQLNESEMGDPVNMSITVGPETSQESMLLGHAGSDGASQIVSPSASYIVAVIKGDSVVVLTADPMPTSTLTASLTDTENDTSPTVTSAPTESIESPDPSRTVLQGASGDLPTVGSLTVG